MKKIELVETYNEGDRSREYLSCRVAGVSAGRFIVKRLAASDEAWEAVKERLFGDADPPAPDGFWDVDERGDLRCPSGAFAMTIYAGDPRSLRRQLRAGAAALAGDDLPEGVERHRDGTLWARGVVAEGLREQGWRVFSMSGRDRSATNMRLNPDFFYEVRPPSTPRTERVAWHEAVERRTEAGRLILEVATDGMGPKYRVGGEWTRVPDGMVTVLAEDGPR